MAFMTGYVVPQHSLEGFFGTLREELILEKADVSITFGIMGVIGIKQTWIHIPKHCII